MAIRVVVTLVCLGLFLAGFHRLPPRPGARAHALGVEQARHAWLTPEDVPNTRPVDELLKRLEK